MRELNEKRNVGTKYRCPYCGEQTRLQHCSWGVGNGYVAPNFTELRVSPKRMPVLPSSGELGFKAGACALCEGVSAWVFDKDPARPQIRSYRIWPIDESGNPIQSMSDLELEELFLPHAQIYKDEI